MKCSNCGHENQEGVKFCVKCGAAYDVSGTGQNKEPEKTEKALLTSNQQMENHTKDTYSGDNRQYDIPYDRGRKTNRIPLIAGIFVALFLVVACYMSYYFGWFPGWGRDLENCIGKDINIVRCLHQVKKADTVGYYIGDNEYFLTLDSENKVCAMSSEDITGTGKFRLKGFYVGQSEEEAKELWEQQMVTAQSTEMYYIGHDSEKNILRVIFDGSKVYKVTMIIAGGGSYIAEDDSTEEPYDATASPDVNNSTYGTYGDDSTGNTYDDTYGDDDTGNTYDDTYGNDDTGNTYNDTYGNDDTGNAYDYTYEDDDTEDFYDDAYDDSDSEYILPQSNERKLKKKDLRGLSKEELRLARNEIYARHGRMFSDQELQDYFDGQSWYSGYIDPEDFVDSEELSAVERYNAKFILKYENR